MLSGKISFDLSWAALGARYKSKDLWNPMIEKFEKGLLRGKVYIFLRAGRLP